MKSALITAAITAMLMVVFALILKVLDAPTRGTALYYVIFAAGVAVNTAHLLQKQQGWQKYAGIAVMPPLAAFGYACWVVFNTKVLIGGPIPSLLLSLEQAKTPEKIASIQRYVDSPELFAANIGVVMTLLGIIVIVAVVPGWAIWRRFNRNTEPVTA